jgi:polygalacturonase
MNENKFQMPEIETTNFPQRELNIKDFGAVGNGQHNDTEAINKAIESCCEAGGGTVVIPRGIYLTGPIHMRSHINLRVEQGAIITFSKNYLDYPLIVTNYEGYESVRCTSPIMGRNLENVAITGDGIFDGSGEVWRPVKKFKTTEKQWNEIIKSGGMIEEGKEEIWWPTEKAYEGKEFDKRMGGKCKSVEVCESFREFFRPVLLSFVNCTKVLLDGPTFQNSPAWCLHPRLCENVIIKNIKVRNSWFSQNGDGIDIESCKYVSLSHSTFDVGDDAICIKSGKNKEGRILGKPSEYISIKDCTVYHGHGGVVIGSEMSGGVYNIEVARCTFIGTDTGLRFKSCRGRGGAVKDIFIDGIDMKDIGEEAITFSTSYNIHTKSLVDSTPEDIPEFKDFYIKNVNCIGAKIGIHLSGLPEMYISNIHFNNIAMKVEKAIFKENTKDIFMDDVEIVES